MSPGTRGRFRRTFVTGLAVLVPLVLAVLIVVWLIRGVDSLLPDLFRPVVFGRPLPGLGIVVVFLLVVLVGSLARSLVGRRLIGFGERAVRWVPVLGATYDVFKQATEAVAKPGGPGYQRVALVEFPRKGLYSIAFVTGLSAPAKARAKLGDDLVSIFVPTTPNPTTGFFMMARRSEIVEVDFTPQEAIRLILSAGLMDSSKELPVAAATPPSP